MLIIHGNAWIKPEPIWEHYQSAIYNNTWKGHTRINTLPSYQDTYAVGIKSHYDFT